MNYKKLYVFIPIYILVIEWFAILYLHYNNPYHFLLMSKGTLLIILLGLFCLILGYFFMHSLYLYKPDTLDNNSQVIKIDEKALGIFIIILSFFAFLGLLLSLNEIAKVTNGLQLYFSNPFLAREHIVMLQEGKLYNVSQMNYRIGSYLCSLMYPLASLGGIAIAQKTRWRFTGLIPLVLVLMYSLINLNRFGLITSLGLWFFTVFYFGIYLKPDDRKKLLKQIFIYSVIAIVLVLLFFYIIMSLRAFYVTNLGYYIKRSFYAYFSGSPGAFEKLLYNDQPLMYGASSFRSIVKWFGRLGLLESSQYLGAHNIFKNIGLGSPMTLNTYTFVKTPYEDFGILGVAGICTIWGMITRYIIERCFEKFSILNLFLVSVFVLSFFMTFYEFFFQGITMFIYWSIILLFIQDYFDKKGIISYVPQ